MMRLLKRPGFILIALITPVLSAAFTQVATKAIPLDAASEMQSRNVKAERVTYKGRTALRVTDTAAADVPSGERLVINLSWWSMTSDTGKAGGRLLYGLIPERSHTSPTCGYPTSLRAI
jgi:hypothetical protein